MLVPEVYVSNYMKQQRNYVKYKRFKASQEPKYLSKGAAESKASLSDNQALLLPKDQ